MNKTVKKITGLLLLVAVLAMLVLPARADNGSINLKDASGTAGDTITVNMEIRPAVSGAEISLSYDTAFLEYVSASGNADYCNISGSGGSISILAYYNSGVGEINISLVFKLLKAGTTYVSIASQTITDANGDPLTMSLAAAEVIIQAKEVPTEPPTPSETNPPETDPPQTDPVHVHEYNVRTVVQENYRTSESADGKYIIYWDQVRYDCACGEAFGDDLLDQENHRELKPAEDPPTVPVPSSEARLSSLHFSGVGEMTPAFDPDIYAYRLTIDTEIDALQVRYSTKDENATAIFWPWIDGQTHDGETKTIPYGETVFTVRVTAEDESTTRDYDVIIVRPAPESQQPETTKAVETTEEPTEPVETTPEETTTEESSEEPTTEELTTEEPTTEETGDPDFISLSGKSVMLRILPLPEDLERPDNYSLVQIVGQGGVSYHALAPKGDSDPDHLLLYGVPIRELPAGTDPEGGQSTPRYEEIGEEGLYVYDRNQGSIQRYGLIRQPETTEAEPETTAAATETTQTTEAATSIPTIPAPTTGAVPPTVPATEAPGPEKITEGKLPWWIWLVILALFAICLAVIIGLLISKDKLEKRLEQAERLSNEEEDAYLGMNTNTLLDAAKAANPPRQYSMDDIENLDDLLDSTENKEE